MLDGSPPQLSSTRSKKERQQPLTPPQSSASVSGSSPLRKATIFSAILRNGTRPAHACDGRPNSRDSLYWAEKWRRREKGSAGGRPVSHDADLYKERNTVERLINKLKAWRGIATRYDKTPASYLAGLHLRASMIWIKDLTRTAP